ncbi:uncharacterized protein LOC143297630 [Babylonia areolata]|uniref:uncharacterized protein LOC143297630 n=1 Tax=Babylonia areolata TaxID=304850 RepID=UPI003FD5021D
MAVNEYLRVLDLSWNGLGYQGAVAIAKSLKKNETLQELDLSHNNINWKGALILSSAVAKNATLRVLRIGGNTLTTTGAKDLVDAASSETSQLRLLDVSGVCVTADTEILATSIGQFRPFSFNHGGVVFMSDIIGRRLDRQPRPMERLLNHLKVRMIRPLELLRQFDKQQQGSVSLEQFAARMRRENIPLHDFEIRALAASISDVDLDSGTAIDYKKLMDSVERHVLLERTRKARDRRGVLRQRQFHRRILSDSTPIFTPGLPYSLLASPSTTSTTATASFFRPPTSLTLPLTLPSAATSTRTEARSAPVLTGLDSGYFSLLSSAVPSLETQPLASVKKTQKKSLGMTRPLQEIGVKAGKKKGKSKVKRKKRSRSEQPTEPKTLVSGLKTETAVTAF